MKELVKHYYLDCGRSCSESLIMAADQKYGLNVSAQTLKSLGAFSGGACFGSMCGAAAGACAAIALRFGAEDLPAHDNLEMSKRCKEFMTEFTQAVGGELCRDIKGKYLTPEQRCLPVPQKAAEILEKYMK